VIHRPAAACRNCEATLNALALCPLLERLRHPRCHQHLVRVAVELPQGNGEWLAAQGAKLRHARW